MDVNRDIAERLHGVANLPIDGFVCVYLINGELHTSAGGKSAEQLHELLDSVKNGGL